MVSDENLGNTADESQKKIMDSVLRKQKQAFLAEGVVSAETRIDRIDRVVALLVDHQKEICDALSSDFGHRSSHLSLLADIAGSIGTLKYSRKHLRKWMKPEKRKPMSPLGWLGAKAWVEYQPKGVVGLISPWNFPIALTFFPLSDVLASGNRCLIKPSEFTPATSELTKHLIAKFFDETEIAVFPGGPEIGEAFSSLPFDHLVFTGGTSVARHVMRAASENLVPVTLELGGKSPVIVGRSAPSPLTVDRLVMGKMTNAGQICIAPDYLFVPEENSDDLVAKIQSTVKRMFPTLKDNPDCTSVLNVRHRERLTGYLDEAREKGATLVEINPANEDFSQQPFNKMPLTLVLNPTDDMRVMQDEIFGPIWPVKTYKDVQEAIDYINSKPRPLALYYFGKNGVEIRRILDHTISGGVLVNDVVMHYNQDDLPFGGIGPSGMGQYRGHVGFKAFSHAKSVLKQTSLDIYSLAGMCPPFDKKAEKVISGRIKK